MAKKTLNIAFRNGGLLPRDVMGTEKDVAVAARVAVAVPETYARQLIDDRFAYEVVEDVGSEDGATKKPKKTKGAAVTKQDPGESLNPDADGAAAQGDGAQDSDAPAIPGITA